MGLAELTVNSVDCERSKLIKMAAVIRAETALKWKCALSGIEQDRSNMTETKEGNITIDYGGWIIFVAVPDIS